MIPITSEWQVTRAQQGQAHLLKERVAQFMGSLPEPCVARLHPVKHSLLGNNPHLQAFYGVNAARTATSR
jgi:hypothetical protein